MLVVWWVSCLLEAAAQTPSYSCSFFFFFLLFIINKNHSHIDHFKASPRPIIRYPHVGNYLEPCPLAVKLTKAQQTGKWALRRAIYPLLPGGLGAWSFRNILNAPRPRVDCTGRSLWPPPPPKKPRTIVCSPCQNRRSAHCFHVRIHTTFLAFWICGS